MKISVHLRGDTSDHDIVARAIGQGMDEAGQDVRKAFRSETPRKDTDLVIQTNFASTPALEWALDNNKPYIIMEAPAFRSMCEYGKWASWGYNGIAGGAYRPEPLTRVRTKPMLQQMRYGDKTIILGQKPTDHSLRGSDHVDWLLQMMDLYPDADFRHHPLMVANSEPINECLSRYHNAVCYTSTAGVDALVMGLTVTAEPGCFAYNVEDREEWLHRLSYCQFHVDELAYKATAEYILDGYEIARTITPEIPRGKLDGKAICERYYKAFGHN